MVVKFFANKKGGSSKAIDYLLNEREAQGTARILKGDEQLTRDIIKGIDYKQKTTVGCLSFEEPNISEDMKYKLMQDFEAMLLPGMQDRYNILWVEHTDKNRLELNFVIPKIELESQKSLNPYYHKADLPRVEMWQDLQNLAHGFTNPKDPRKARTVETNNKEIHLSKDYEQLDKLLHNLAEQGQIKNREHLIELLKSNSIEVTRQGSDYLAIKLPDSKKAKRFKGSIYNEQFTSIREIETISNTAEQRTREYSQRDTQAELREIKSRLEDYTRNKSDELSKKYKKRKNINIYSNSNFDIAEHNNNLSNDETAIEKRNDYKSERKDLLTTGRKQTIKRQENLHTGELENDTFGTDVIERIRRAREERQRDIQRAIGSFREQQQSYSRIAETISRYAKEFGYFAGEKILSSVQKVMNKTKDLISSKKENEEEKKTQAKKFGINR